MKNPAYMEVHQHNKTACQKSVQMVVFSWAVVSFCIELFCVVTLQYQILVRIAIAYFIIEKKNAVNTKKTVRKNMLLRTVCIFGQFCKLEFITPK